MTTPSPEDQALRFNEGKPELGRLLEFGSALDKLVAVMQQGATKYEEANWLLGGKPDREYIDSALRHLQAFSAGEEFDPDIGTHHLAHAAWNMLALLRLNRDDAPRIDPEFDQEAFVKKYTGQEITVAFVDDDGSVTSSTANLTNDEVVDMILDSYPGWRVGDVFWRAGAEHTRWVVLEVLDESTGHILHECLTAPNPTSTRNDSHLEFDSYRVRR